VIKRALLLALAVLALALFAVLRPTAPDVERLAPPEGSKPAVRAGRAVELDAPTAVSESSRASLAAPAGETSEAVAPAPAPLVRVRVRVRGPGTPVPGATVLLGGAQGTTGVDGVSALSLPQETHLALLKVVPGEDGPPFVPYERNLDQLLPQWGCEFEVLVDRGVDLRGVVVDAATGRTVERANLRYNGFGYRTVATSREDGSFQFQALLAGAWNVPGRVHVEHPAYLPTQIRPTVPDLEPGAEPLRIALTSGLRVAGRIVDRERAPIAGAELTLSANGARSVRSDELGRFEFGGLEPAENATLFVATQSIVDEAILGTDKELGALEASRLDVEIEVRAALRLQIQAELADGTQLRRSLFEVSCPNSVAEGLPGLAMVSFGNDPLFHERILPRDLPFEVEAFASAQDASDPQRYLRGRLRVRPERGAVSPLQVRVVLTEPYRVEIPPAPPNAPEVDLGGGTLLHGAFDAQLLHSADGKPIAGGRYVTLHFGESMPLLMQESGWLRLRGGPGQHSIELQYGTGPRERFTFVIPWTGYAQGEWRLKAGR
jgi:hypothetical protein